MTIVQAHAQTFEQFTMENSVALQAFAFLVIGNREDARDAVQDALLGAYKRWDRLGDDPLAYVRRSIVNANISAWRKRRRETPVAQVQSNSWDQGPQVETTWVRRMCGNLPTKQRAAVIMRYYEDMSFAQIAEILGCPETTARSLLHRGLAQLRANIQQGES
ncbi:MAG: SigE family RNA polymerase sigma factor [Propionibacteriaceae bacterium]|jgi:RNA polymerase sigma-70 factor (sigma-E family)|nr:SigE family RNA polymerase sigma factor [Propionibacteriaceae bacterium]